MASSFVSQDEFNLFHSIDRELYTILVIELWRDPVESMQIMALWLWMERVSFTFVVKKMLSLPSILINELAEEAIVCLKCIHSDYFTPSSEIPLIQILMEIEISLKYFYDNRVKASQGVRKIMNEICHRAFSDIMQLAVDRNTAQSLVENQNPARVSSFEQSSSPARFPQFGTVTEDMFQPGRQGTTEIITAEDRTMFLTFSKGYPVNEWELIEFFRGSYGDCIESLHMQDVERQEQALFARIVFRSSATIMLVLSGMDKAKFTINGKHVWARKFVPKRPKLPQPSALPSFPPPS